MCWKLVLLNHPDIVKKLVIFLFLFFCFSTSPFDGLQSSILWKYFNEWKQCGKILLSAFRCTCTQNQIPLELHNFFRILWEYNIAAILSTSLLYLSVNTSDKFMKHRANAFTGLIYELLLLWIEPTAREVLFSTVICLLSLTSWRVLVLNLEVGTIELSVVDDTGKK